MEEQKRTFNRTEQRNELNITGESFELDFYITTQNDANPTNNMDAGIVLTYEGESLKFLFNRATTLGETLSVSNSFSIVIPDENTFALLVRNL